jgi:hypothetical protein
MPGPTIIGRGERDGPRRRTFGCSISVNPKESPTHPTPRLAFPISLSTDSPPQRGHSLRQNPSKIPEKRDAGRSSLPASLTREDAGGSPLVRILGCVFSSRTPDLVAPYSNAACAFRSPRPISGGGEISSVVMDFIVSLRFRPPVGGLIDLGFPVSVRSLLV